MLTRVVFLANLLFLAIPSFALFLRGSPKFASIEEITVPPPSRLVRRGSQRQATQPVISISNTSDWPEETNQLCMNAINISTINNPAGVVPCYNVLSWDPNTGNFMSEVRLFQVVNLEQKSVLDQATGSGVLFEFPFATVTGVPSDANVSSLLMRRAIELSKRQNQNIGPVNNTSAFYLNGTADPNQNG
jgi:hypothetical protein